MVVIFHFSGSSNSLNKEDLRSFETTCQKQSVTS